MNSVTRPGPQVFCMASTSSSLRLRLFWLRSKILKLGIRNFTQLGGCGLFPVHSFLTGVDSEDSGGVNPTVSREMFSGQESSLQFAASAVRTPISIITIKTDKKIIWL